MPESHTRHRRDLGAQRAFLDEGRLARRDGRGRSASCRQQGRDLRVGPHSAVGGDRLREGQLGNRLATSPKADQGISPGLPCPISFRAPVPCADQPKRFALFLPAYRLPLVSLSCSSKSRAQGSANTPSATRRFGNTPHTRRRILAVATTPPWWPSECPRRRGRRAGAHRRQPTRRSRTGHNWARWGLVLLVLAALVGAGLTLHLLGVRPCHQVFPSDLSECSRTLDRLISRTPKRLRDGCDRGGTRCRAPGSDDRAVGDRPDRS